MTKNRQIKITLTPEEHVKAQELADLCSMPLAKFIAEFLRNTHFFDIQEFLEEFKEVKNQFDTLGDILEEKKRQVLSKKKVPEKQA